LRKKVSNVKADFRTGLKAFLVIVILFGIGLAQTHQRKLIYNSKRELGEKRAQEAELLKSREQLKKEISLLKTFSRVEKKALRIGMVYPRDWQIVPIYISKNSE